ncbi:putative sulfate exporter family transporter [Roseovarius sp. LXJ103]|uniref:YeiH family protein n=1 Tax=Roseovarius carneus TaxID=2853164 RepID=UPI000D6114BF|nr:putative sulfate exporter family transporter [Roseovarius carneus]MBZ8119953.1 putative sulfate exporter family transporter [Roseovarius carneus]PWE34458.1 putative sulfate exporter family transporter [Pelagicola sp. LXJ1103]
MIFSGWVTRTQAMMPGVTVAVIIALASKFISEHYGAPSMLLALLFGISLNFLSVDERCGPGVTMSARTLLRLGVALLGLRISFDMVGALGWPIVAMVVTMVPVTILFGLLASRFFGFRYRFAFLSAGAVAICGASAALAIAAILPKDEKSDDRLVFTVVGVTILSTVAMIAYPILSQFLGFDDVTAGIYLGATIHDVAQVVGAGFSISEEAGETATLVKLLRVAMLAPVVIIASIFLRSVTTSDASGARPPLIPGFVLAFILLAALNSMVALPAPMRAIAVDGSGWFLLTAIAAVGLKTRPVEILKVGKPAAALLLAETVFLATMVALALTYLPLLPT